MTFRYFNPALHGHLTVKHVITDIERHTEREIDALNESRGVKAKYDCDVKHFTCRG